MPYASVILPTLNRHTTLPCALASVQAQTVRDIEILLVLDGATPACREIAFSTASKDPRVRVLDLPKGRGGGAEHVQHAVEIATAERIFYIDDDDLFLDVHVEVLAPLLQAWDVAQSRVATAARSGQLHLAPCATAHPVLKRLLVENRHKILFDTHFAHRKSAFRAHGNWIGSDPDGDPVWQFLNNFAEAPVAWGSSGRVTALSLHGANRRDMPDTARGAEIAEWACVLADPARRTALFEASQSAYHLYLLLRASAPDEAETFSAYLHRHGAYADVHDDAAARDAMTLFQRRPLDPDRSIALAGILAQPVFVGYQTKDVASRFYLALGMQRTEGIFSDLAGRSGPHQAGALAILADLSHRQGRTEQALRHIARALGIGPDPLGQLGDLQAEYRTSEARDADQGDGETGGQGVERT